MSSLSTKNASERVKRLPFVDKTNIVRREIFRAVLSNGVSSTKDIIKYSRSVDPKFNLNLKVHLKPFSTVINKLSNTSTWLNSENPTIEHILSNDSKFRINPKVLLKRLNITNRMPNLQSTNIFTDESMPRNKRPIKEASTHETSIDSNLKERGAFGKHSRDYLVSTEANELKNNLKNVKPIHCNSKKDNFDPKFYQQPIVQVNRCKELEKALKAEEKAEHIVKKVHFEEGNDRLPKLAKTLRKKRIKNYAELSFKDSLSPQQNIEQGYKEHVPVYLQHEVMVQKQKEKDPFEFHSESFTRDRKKKGSRGRPRKEVLSPLQHQKRKRGRPAKEENSDSDSSCYDECTKEVLKEVRLKLSPKKCKYRKRAEDDSVKKNRNVKPSTSHVRTAQVLPSKVRQDKVDSVSNVNSNSNKVRKQIVLPIVQQNSNGVLKKNANDVASNINEACLSKHIKNKKTLDLSTRETEIAHRGILRIPNQSIVETVSVKDDCDAYFGFDDDDCENDVTEVALTPQGSNTSTRLANIKPVTLCQKFTSLTSTPLPRIQSQKVTDPKRKINLISDIMVSPSRTTRSTNRTHQSILKSAAPSVAEISIPTAGYKTPVVNGGQRRISEPSSSVKDSEISKNADLDVIEKSVELQTRSSKNDVLYFNSTTNRSFRQRLNQNKSPWRVYDSHIKRNPHFLVVKDTSLLPCYNQEMVLEPKLLERPITTLNVEKAESSKVQASILDYVSSNKMNSQSTPTKNDHDKTLFDENEFSPIKSQKSNNLNSEECAVNGSDEKNIKGKRNILGVKRKKCSTSPLSPSNKQNISSESDKEFIVENYFGFDSPEDRRTVGKENIKVKRKRAKLRNYDEIALPMRVPVKQLKKVREEAVTELLNKVVVPVEENPAEELTLQETVENNSCNEEPHVGLFEDLWEANPPPRVYSRKRTKRVRIASIDSDIVEEEKPKRKRKDIPTAAEEEKFNQWAASFNAMCNEVEQYNLEME